MKLRVGLMMGCHAATQLEERKRGKEGEAPLLRCRNFAVIRGEQRRLLAADFLSSSGTGVVRVRVRAGGASG
jgi:hypothetical protein